MTTFDANRNSVTGEFLDSFYRSLIMDELFHDINSGKVKLSEEEMKILKTERQLPERLMSKINIQRDEAEKKLSVNNLIHNELMRSEMWENLEKYLNIALGDNPTEESIFRSVTVIYYLDISKKLYNMLIEVMSRNNFEYLKLPPKIRYDLVEFIHKSKN